MKIIDEAAFVNMNRRKSSTTYGMYCEEQLLKKHQFVASQSIQILDVVFDVYLENSLKSQTRQNRGEGIRVSVCKNIPVCKDFQKFLRNDPTRQNFSK